MNKDTIKLLENNTEKEYRLLSIIDNKYIIYTDIDNINIYKDIYVVKVNQVGDNQNTIPISDEELKIVNQKYLDFMK